MTSSTKNLLKLWLLFFCFCFLFIHKKNTFPHLSFPAASYGLENSAVTLTFESDSTVTTKTFINEQMFIETEFLPTKQTRQRSIQMSQVIIWQFWSCFCRDRLNLTSQEVSLWIREQVERLTLSRERYKRFLIRVECFSTFSSFFNLMALKSLNKREENRNGKSSEKLTIIKRRFYAPPFGLTYHYVTIKMDLLTN